MPYLKKRSMPTGYRVARWHPSGKLWLSNIEFGTSEAAEDHRQKMIDFAADLNLGAIKTDYFIWHASMSDADLEPYKAETPSNKIKNPDPH